MGGEIRVTRKTAGRLPYEEIKLLQGRLKKRTGEQIEKIALIVQNGLLIDIITKKRERVCNGKPAVKQPNNSRGSHAG